VECKHPAGFSDESWQGVSLQPDTMDTLMWKLLLAILIFAEGNIAYFEIRRLIHFLRNHHLHKGTRPSDGGAASLDRNPAVEQVN
jgi:hypothetical protein